MILFRVPARFVEAMLLGLLFLPVAGWAQPASNLPPLPEDLMPALRPILASALAQSPQMIVQNINLASAESTRIQNFAGLLPQLAGSMQYSRSESAIAQSANIKSAASGFFYSLSLYQPIYQWGALKNRADSGKIGVKIAERQYADAYRLLVTSLRSQFVGLVTKKVTLRNYEYALNQAEETLALAQERLKTGRASTEEMTEPRLAVDEARLARDRAVEDLEYSRKTFLLTVGQSDLDLDSVPDDVPRPAYDADVAKRLLQEFIQSDAANTYQIMVYRGYIKQADIDYRIARVNLLPKLGFSGVISQANVTSASANSVSQVGVASNSWNIVASWSIFDGFATRGAKLAALSRKRSYERTLRTNTDQTIAQARDLEQQLGFYWRGLELSQTRRDLSDSAVKRLEDNLKRGEASQAMVNAAKLNFYNWELNLTNARGYYLGYWSQYVSMMCVDPMLALVPAGYLKDGK